MTLPLVVSVAVACLALAAWAGLYVATDRAVVLRQLWGAAVVEGLLVVQAVVAAVLAAMGSAANDPLLLWGYIASGLVLLPVAAGWAFAERTRWSSVVLLVAAVTGAFLQVRLWQIWTTP